MEYLRPWKLITFSIGMLYLFFGALTYQISDWDVYISIIMGVMTYITAPWAVRVVIMKRWLWMPLALYFYWITVDGLYMSYHTWAGNETYRIANFFASTALYWLCGFIWCHKGTLKQLTDEKRVII
jgi:hypothetical protein